MPGGMRTFRAAVAASFALTAGGQSWKGWGTCQNQELAEKEVLQEADRRLNTPGEVIQPAEFKEAHQIVRISNFTGKFEVNENAKLWNQLEQIDEEIHIVVVFGVKSAGTSLVASMLGCAFNNGDEATTEFPSARTKSIEGQDRHTVGLWASDPFKFKPEGETGPEKTYVIMDVMGLKHSDPLVPGLSTKVIKDAAVKMNAMLSEIASEFVYVSPVDRGTLNDESYNDLGLAMKTTRESLVRASEDFESDEDQKVNIRSTDHPGLIMATREKVWGANEEVVDENLAYLEAKWDGHSVTKNKGDYGTTKTVLTANFKNHTLNVNGQEELVPWIYHPLARVQHKFTNGDTYLPFDWDVNSYPFRRNDAQRTQGDSCRQYKAMRDDTNYQCQESVDQASQPSGPTTYRVLLDHLAKEIYDHAPNREVTWGEAQPQPLTGSRTKGFLVASVEEINKAGPVRDNELWRLIMEDRCFKDYKTYIEDYYLNRPGLFNDMTNRLNTITATITQEVSQVDSKQLKLEEMTWNPEKLAERNLTFISTWDQAHRSYPDIENTFFLENVLLQTVRDRCRLKGVTALRLIDQKARRIFSRMALLGEEAENRILEAEVRKLQAEVNRLWWQANMPYIIAFTMIGLIVIYMLMNMFGQVCQTCKACAMCCGDLSTTDHEHKIIHVTHGPDGTEMAGGARPTAAPLIGGVAAPAAVVMPGGADPALQQRIEELEAVVLQLAAKVPKKDLQEMNLKGV